jgi:hypothetical protein
VDFDTKKLSSVSSMEHSVVKGRMKASDSDDKKMAVKTKIVKLAA